jgi:hypothetical protein
MTDTDEEEVIILDDEADEQDSSGVPDDYQEAYDWDSTPAAAGYKLCKIEDPTCEACQ